MPKVTVRVEYSKDMSMGVQTMLDNIEYVLAEHFKEMDGYRLKDEGRPKVLSVKVEEESKK